jgi:hypothetical protein
MKKIILLAIISLTAIFANDYLVKIPYTDHITSSILIKQGFSIVGELSNAAIVLAPSSKLANLKDNEYNILNEVRSDKNYFLAVPMTDQTKTLIKNEFRVLATDHQTYLVTFQSDAENKLVNLPAMITKLDFTPLTLSEPSPIFPDVVLNPLVQQMVNNVSSDTVIGFIRRLQNFRSRYSTSDSCLAAANWIRNKLIDYDCDSVFLHSFSASYKPNVIGIKRGLSHPDNMYYVICGHFDAVSNCPGADDNASGTTAVLEAARVMQSFNFEYSVRYIAFCAEEQGLIGSAAYAQEARNRGDSILGVFNFDMIGYADINPENLEVFGKVSNPNCSTFVNYIINAAALYVPELATNRRMVTSLSGSDHHSFWQRGYVGICGIEDYSLTNPYYHTSADSIGAGFNNLTFCTNSIKAGVASLSGLANPIYPNQPLVVYRNYRINDLIGNNNGRWDVGETTNVNITLRNIGQQTANNVSATITSSAPYVVILQNQSNYGNILSQDTAVNLTLFKVASTNNTPIGYNASFNLIVTSAETTWNYNFAIPIGAFMTFDPIPDGPRSPARYWAYDNTDTTYFYRPTYNWNEIKNIGTRISFDNNDQVRKIALPQNFGLRFYGQHYDTISVSVDGFIRIGADTTRAYTNSAIPSLDGPAPMIAVNWDDLYHANTGNYGGIWWYYNSASRTFIVEWDSVYYYNATSVREKFQLILYDSTYSAPYNDNVIIAQYMTANGYTSSTIGIEDPTETIGIQYLFNGTYHPASAPIQIGRAVKYTTQSPTAIFDYQDYSSLLTPRSLLKVHPNPFRGQTIIQLNTPLLTGKSVKIYNSSGRIIKSFSPHSSLLTPYYTLTWDGKDQFGKQVGAGIYFINVDGVSKPEKIIRLK